MTFTDIPAGTLVSAAANSFRKPPMQSFQFEATFENGVLKPDRPLPLVEHQRIKLSVELPTPAGSSIDSDLEFIRETSGILGWTGDAETVERIALNPEFGIHESP